MVLKNVVSWTTMIRAFSELDDGKALEMYRRMLVKGVDANKVTHVMLLSMCSNFHSLDVAKRFHVVINETGDILDVVLGSALVVTYGQCGTAKDAFRVFSLLPQLNLITWNGMISVFAHSGLKVQAFQHFEKMQQKGIEPDSVSFTTVLSQCTSLDDLTEGRIVHVCGVQLGIDFHETVGCALVEMYGLCEQGERLYGYSVECELEADITVNTAIVRMYGKFGRLEDALWVFRRAPVRGLVAWNSIISAYASHGHFEDILLFNEQMKGEEVKPNEVTFTVMLEGCSNFKEGKIIHDLIVQNELEAMPEICNALISMYLHFKEVFKLLHKVQHETVKVDEITLTHALSACTSLAASEEGKLIFAYAVDVGVHISAVVLSALVSMFSNCNQVKDAQNVFRRIHEHDVISCTAMIVAYVRCGQTKGALSVLQFMQEKRIEPSDICIISILSACSHSGLVDAGCNLFLSTINLYGLMPTLRHFCFLLDILSRSDNTAALSEESNLDVNIIEQQEESVLLCGADRFIWLA
ncbi:hypothetical protein L7F22_016817 [Adiantum nelumboides]|nr:hypothetical protein [Adiantum nelumboides]